MPASKRVLLQFRVIANAVRSSARTTRDGHTVADRKLRALGAIAQSPGLGVNDLADALGVRQPTASQLVKALAQLRLIAVERDDHDRRAVRIHVSDDGWAILRQFPARLDFADRLPAALTQLDGDLLVRLESVLTRLVQALTRQPSSFEPRGGEPSNARHKPQAKALER